MQRFAAACSIALLLTAAPSAQQARFKSGVDLVTVDVAVLNASGQPIPGLTADDFELSVDGSKRRIVWSEFVPHRTDVALDVRRLRRIGLVAIGRAFGADLALGGLRLFQ